MVTYGMIVWHDGQWTIRCQPHVRIKLKRLFPRISQYTTGDLTITDTPETSADLLWVLDRWPMELDDDTADRLERRAVQYRTTRANVERILDGYQPPNDWNEFAVPPRDYQTVAANLCMETGALLLGDDVGIGKTATSLLLLRDPARLPALVVTLTHLPRQWANEVDKFTPWLTPHVIRTGPVYDPMARQGTIDARYGADVLIINYHKLDKWRDYLTGVVRTVIFDEAQELRRNTSNKWAAAVQIASEATTKIQLTATPVYNYGDEIHNVISVIDGEVLGTRTEFLREWCGASGKVADPAALGTYLRDEGIMLRRTRKDVGRELPPIIRIPHTVDVDEARIDEVASDATVLAEQIVAATGTNFDLMRLSGDFDWRLRQATGIAKAHYVADFVRLLVESGEPTVLFAWHRAVYDIINERLAILAPAMYTGSESPERKIDNAQRFLDGDTDLLIMSLRAGAGLDGLQERSKIAVFGELDWSPAVHTQAIGRLARDGQTEPVLAYFLVADSGSDPVVAETLNLKRQQSDPIVDPDAVTIAPVDTTDRVKRMAADFLARRATVDQPAFRGLTLVPDLETED